MRVAGWYWPTWFAAAYSIFEIPDLSKKIIPLVLILSRADLLTLQALFDANTFVLLNSLSEQTIWDNCWRVWLFSLPDIWSSCRDLWIQIFPGWSRGCNIRHTWAEACCWKLDSGIYNGHLTCEDASWYSIANFGLILEHYPKNVYSLLPLGLVLERPSFLGCLLICFFHCKADSLRAHSPWYRFCDFCPSCYSIHDLRQS